MNAREFRRKLGGRRTRKAARRALETYRRMSRSTQDKVELPTPYKHLRQELRMKVDKEELLEAA
ncbi:MAG TPA: hypothetical protein VM163_05370 [bacterium]|nr:hypothetical protein [bacterium]